MKNLILLTTILLISFGGFTQKITADKVPAPVKQAFAKKFPAATNIKYEMEKKDYEINFKDKGVEMSANFDATGKWLETETEIKESALPKEITASVAKNFAGFKTSEVAKVETPDKGTIYEMDLKKGKERYEVQFSTTGEVLKKTLQKKGEDEKD
ncbi:MAG: PepSY-like domain-containing protein [Bacteroidetes bacterium]|nr:PepSY-like domain-containing protein [Bacteroidota bacterium]